MISTLSWLRSTHFIILSAKIRTARVCSSWITPYSPGLLLLQDTDLTDPLFQKVKQRLPDIGVMKNCCAHITKTSSELCLSLLYSPHPHLVSPGRTADPAAWGVVRSFSWPPFRGSPAPAFHGGLYGSHGHSCCH